jgi:hypothetical protein
MWVWPPNREGSFRDEVENHRLLWFGLMDLKEEKRMELGMQNVCSMKLIREHPPKNTARTSLMVIWMDIERIELSNFSYNNWQAF